MQETLITNNKPGKMLKQMGTTYSTHQTSTNCTNDEHLEVAGVKREKLLLVWSQKCCR